MEGPQNPLNKAPQIDTKFSIKTGELFGTVRRAQASQEMEHYKFHSDEEQAEARRALDEFLGNTMDQLRRLSIPRNVEYARKGNDLDDYADGLAIVANHFGRAKENEIKGYELYSPELIDEFKRKDAGVKEVFAGIGQKTFPEISPNESSESLMQTAKSQIEPITKSGGFLARAHELWLEKAETKIKEGDFQTALAQVDAALEWATNSIGIQFNYGGREGDFGVGTDRRHMVVLETKFIYTLGLLHDSLAKEIENK